MEASDQRYSRQELFAPIGREGQAKIQASSVVLVGCGALGTHLAESMVRAGVAELTIIDRDFVEASNLQRQSLFTEADAEARLPKALAAKTHLRAISSETEIHAQVANLDCENAEDWLEDADLILDGSDNFQARFLINDIAVRHEIPWVYAACVASSAMSMPILPGRSACLNCLMEDLPLAHGETCDTAGIIMPAVLAAVSMASTSALQILSGAQESIHPQLRMQDLWRGQYQSLSSATPNPECSVCAKREFAYLSGRLAPRAVSLCGRNAVQLFPRREQSLSLDQLAGLLGNAHQVERPNEHLIEVYAEDLRLTLFEDGRALVSGTNDIAKAQAITARLLGV